jgi:alpha-L-fucosidase
MDPAALTVLAALAQSPPAPAPPDMDWWRDARFGMFIHWGLYSESGGVWKGTFLPGWSEWMLNRLKIPPAEYQQELVPRFDPADFDAAAWVRAARDAGMGYMVITTKHHEGFAIWQSGAGELDVAATPFGKTAAEGGRGRDPLKELADAAAADGMPLGFYYSLLDWSHPDYLPRRPWESRSAEGADYSRYVDFMTAQVRELLGGGYGKVAILWGDGDWEHSMAEHRSDAIVAMARQLQPGILVNDRWAQPGDYATPENKIPDAALGRPWETCMTLNDSWGYARDDANFKPASTVTRMLVDCTSKDGNFLLNVGPTGRGTIDGRTLGVLREVGQWMHTYGESVRGCGAAPIPQPEWGRITWRAAPAAPEGGVTAYLHVWAGDAGAGTELRLPGVLDLPSSVTVLGEPGEPRALAERDGADTLIRIVAGRSGADAATPVVALRWDSAPAIALPPRIAGDVRIFIDSMPVKFDPASPQCEIRVTTDGRAPDATSTLVTAGRDGAPSLTIRDTCTLRAVTLWNGQPVGSETRAEFTRVEPLAPISRTDSMPGLSVRLLEGSFERVPAREAFAGDASAWRASVPDVRLPADRPPEHFAVLMSGYIDVPSTGIYRFGIASDDGSVLEIDSKVVVDHDGPHGATEKTGDVALSAGRHRISIRYFEATGSEALSLRWQPPGTRELAPVPASRLSH